MHGTTIKKNINAQQAKLCSIYKNIRLKLLKTNAAIWFNKMCRIKHLKPNHIDIKSRTQHSEQYTYHTCDMLPHHRITYNDVVFFAEF